MLAAFGTDVFSARDRRTAGLATDGVGHLSRGLTFLYSVQTQTFLPLIKDQTHAITSRGAKVAVAVAVAVAHTAPEKSTAGPILYFDPEYSRTSSRSDICH